MKKIFLVNHGTYPFDILICIGSTHKEILTWLKKNKKIKLSKEDEDSLFMEGNGRTSMLESGATVMRIRNLKNKCDFHATLAHEIFHSVEFLFDKIGLPHKLSSGEAYAYQIQYITGSIYEKLK